MQVYFDRSLTNSAKARGFRLVATGTIEAGEVMLRIPAAETLSSMCVHIRHTAATDTHGHTDICSPLS